MVAWLSLQELACSLRRSNPEVELLVMTVEGDLSIEVERQVAAQAKMVYVEDFPVSRDFYRFSPVRQLPSIISPLQEAVQKALAEGKDVSKTLEVEGKCQCLA